MTMGPYHATGSLSGSPDTSKNRMPSSPACTTTSSPGSNRTREWLSASDGGAVSNHFTLSVGTVRGADALQNFPAPAKTYAKAFRAVAIGSVFLFPDGTETSRYIG